MMTLLKGVAAGATEPVVLAAALVYSLFAGAFALVLFRSPV
jgi:hypothetical protein